jgi:hypothetical protein
LNHGHITLLPGQTMPTVPEIPSGIALPPAPPPADTNAQGALPPNPAPTTAPPPPDRP